MNWTNLRQKGDHALWRTTTDFGQWTISTGGRGKNIFDIKFMPPFPDGMDAKIIRDRMSALDKKHGDEWTDVALWLYLSPSELGYANSFVEAELLISMLEKGDADLPSAEETITSLGFVPWHQHDNWLGHFSHYMKDKTGAGCVISDDGIAFDYDVGATSHLIMRLNGDHRADHNNSYAVKVPYPRLVTDYKRVGAAFIARIVELRLAREKTRFYMPLAEV